MNRNYDLDRDRRGGSSRQDGGGSWGRERDEYEGGRGGRESSRGNDRSFASEYSPESRTMREPIQDRGEDYGRWRDDDRYQLDSDRGRHESRRDDRREEGAGDYRSDYRRDFDRRSAMGRSEDGGREQRGSSFGGSFGGGYGGNYSGGWGEGSSYGPQYGQYGRSDRSQSGQYGQQGQQSGYGTGFGSPSWGSRGSGSESTQAYGWRDENREGSDGGHRGKGPRNYQRSDTRIQEDLNDRLTDDHDVDASNIECSVKSGEVTLTGTVSSRQEKRRAEACAEAISGVKDVNNQLKVRKSSSSSSSDDGSRSASAGASSGSSSGKNR